MTIQLSDLKFQEIKISELSLVLEFFKTAAEKINKKNVDHWQYWKNPPQEKIEWVTTGIQNHEFFFIILNDTEQIGMVRIMNIDEPYWGITNDKAKYIHSLVIKDQYNGKGLGSLVIEKITEIAKQENCEFLRLDAVSKNIGLCNYYERIGFQKVGVKEGKLSTNTLFQKQLS